MMKLDDYWRSSMNILILVIAMMSFISCKGNEEKGQGRIVATLDDSHLFEDELLTVGLALDSGMVTLNYISKWAKNQLVLNHANQLSKEEFDVDIDQLVDKYRINLLRAYYEKYLVQSQLDTVVMDEEIKIYYSKHKSEFKLGHKIIKCRLVKVKKKDDNKKLISKLIKSNKAKDETLLLNFCNQKAKFCLTVADKWYNWKDIKVYFPDGIHLNKRDIGKSVRTESKKYAYYIYLIDYLSYKDNAPFTYIKSQAKKAILFNRRQHILENKKEELYNNALKDNRIKIFLGN